MDDLNRAWLARSAVAASQTIESCDGVIAHIELTGIEEERWRERIENNRWLIREVERLMPDADLRRACLSTSGPLGDPETEALAAECERRNIDL